MKRVNDSLSKVAQLDYEKNVDNSPAILWITEIGGSCTYLSRQWYEFTVQSKSEALGFGWLDATHPDENWAISMGNRRR